MSSVIIEDASMQDYRRAVIAITQFNLNHLPENTNAYIDSIGFVLKYNNYEEPIGFIFGRIILGGGLYVDLLFVDEKYRNQGYGTKLLQAIEKAATKKRSHLSVVDTFDFQALGFYEKADYKVFGTLDDSPCIGNKRYYLSKRLK